MNIIYIVLFILLVISYIIVIPKHSLDYWWVGINKQKWIYYPFLISLLFALISYIYIIYYYTFKETKLNIYLLLVLVFSIVWSIKGYFGYLKLSVVSLGIIGIMALVMFFKTPKDWNPITISTGYLAFHTFFMDFIIWSAFLLAIKY